MYDVVITDSRISFDLAAENPISVTFTINLEALGMRAPESTIVRMGGSSVQMATCAGEETTLCMTRTAQSVSIKVPYAFDRSRFAIEGLSG